jgi:hypothetical protein
MERKKMIGILAGGVVAVGLGVAGMRHATAPDSGEVAGNAKLRELGARLPGGAPPPPITGGVGAGIPVDPGVPGAPVASAPRVTAAGAAVQHIKVPPTKKALREEGRRVARERAIAAGKLAEFEKSEKERADKEARKKAEREKRREVFRKKLADRRAQLEAARKAGVPPPRPQPAPAAPPGAQAPK